MMPRGASISVSVSCWVFSGPKLARATRVWGLVDIGGVAGQSDVQRGDAKDAHFANALGTLSMKAIKRALVRITQRPAASLAKAVLVVLLVATVTPAHAIPPCPPSPCFKPDRLDTVFDEPACREASTWIATGRIASVRRRHEGPPRHRVETATFELQIVRWEKGVRPADGKLELRIGWCGPSLPRSTAGIWRFWGTGGPVKDASGDRASTAAHHLLFLQRLPSGGRRGNSAVGHGGAR